MFRQVTRLNRVASLRILYPTLQDISGKGDITSEKKGAKDWIFSYCCSKKMSCGFYLLCFHSTSREIWWRKHKRLNIAVVPKYIYYLYGELPVYSYLTELGKMNNLKIRTKFKYQKNIFFSSPKILYSFPPKRIIQEGSNWYPLTFSKLSCLRKKVFYLRNISWT